MGYGEIMGWLYDDGCSAGFIRSISHHRQFHKHRSGSDACTSSPIVRQPLQTPGNHGLHPDQYKIRNHPNTPTVQLPQSLFAPVITEHEIPIVLGSRYSPNNMQVLYRRGFTLMMSLIWQSRNTLPDQRSSRIPSSNTRMATQSSSL